MYRGLIWLRDKEGDAGGGAGGSSAAPAAPAPVPAAPAAAATGTPGIDAPLLPDEFGIDDPADGQPAPSQPATSAKPDAAAPGDDGTANPAAEAPDPARLDPEVVKAVVAGHLDIALQTPEVQAAVQELIQSQVDTRLAQERAAPQSDVQWVQFEQAAAASYQTVADALEAYSSGQALPDVRDLATHIANIPKHTQAAERRAHFHSTEATVDAFEKSILADPEGLDQQLVAEYRALRDQGREMYRRLNNGTAENRDKAWQSYLDSVIPGLMNLALADGQRIGAWNAQKQYERDLTVKENNAAVQSYARLQAGLPPPAAGGAASQPSELTAASIAAMDDDEYERRRPEIMALAARELQEAR